MSSCSRCGATLAPQIARCEYCGSETPYGVELRRQEAARQAAVDHASLQQAAEAAAYQRQNAEGAIRSASKTALVWGGIGLLVCCIPIPAIVGTVLGLRAKSLAKRHELVAPWQSTAAVVLGLAGMVGFALLVVIGIREEAKRDDRVAELERQIATTQQHGTLDVTSACALAELTLLRGGGGQPGGSLRVFRCNGPLSDVRNGRALLQGIEFSRSSGDVPLRAKACLVRGVRWSVEALGERAACDKNP